MKLEQLKKGFHFSENDNPWACEDWIYQAEESNNNKAVFYGYDANLFPLPKFSEVNKGHRERVIKKALKHFEGLEGEVWFDDVRIK